jgi:hypothetical protein
MRPIDGRERGGDFGSGRKHDHNGFVASWLQANLPPFYAAASVVELAARLRADATAAGIDISAIERSDPFALEQMVLAALNSSGVPAGRS